LLVDYDKGKAVLFSIMHDIREIRTKYRRIRMRIQGKVENLAAEGEAHAGFSKYS